jgi:predicted secreted protein
MAKFVIQNPVVTLAGGTVSANVAQATIALESDDVETTNFAGGGWRERIGGLKSGTVSLDFHQDYAAGSIDSVVYPLLGGTAAVTIRPAGTAAIGSASPQYELVALVTEYSPVEGAVGDLATFSVSWPINGEVTRKTTA